MNPQSEAYAAKLLQSNALHKKKINAERGDPVTSTRPYSEGFGFKPQPEGCPSLRTSCDAVR
jgi:hypothetical protein